MFGKCLMMLMVVVLLMGDQAEGLKIKLTENLPAIATFHSKPLYEGNAFPIAALYHTCYNFRGRVESIKLAPDTQFCELYSGDDCTELDANSMLGGGGSLGGHQPTSTSDSITKKIGDLATAFGIFSRSEKGGTKRVSNDIVELKFRDGKGMGEGEAKVRSLKCQERKK